MHPSLFSFVKRDGCTGFFGYHRDAVQIALGRIAERIAQTIYFVGMLLDSFLLIFYKYRKTKAILA